MNLFKCEIKRLKNVRSSLSIDDSAELKTWQSIKFYYINIDVIEKMQIASVLHRIINSVSYRMASNFIWP